MQKRMTILAAACTAAVLLTATACSNPKELIADPNGGSGTAVVQQEHQQTTEQKLSGSYTAVVAESMNVQMSVEHVFDAPMALQLTSSGSVELTVGEEVNAGEWTQEDDTITMSFEEDGNRYQFSGTVFDDHIVFDDLMNTGVKVTFGKKNTDAAKTVTYLSAEEASAVGKWASETVDCMDGFGAQPEMKGVEDIHDALRMEIRDDYTCTISFQKDEPEELYWSSVGGMITLDSKRPRVLAQYNEDGSLTVTFSEDRDFEDVYTFVCLPVKE